MFIDSFYFANVLTFSCCADKITKDVLIDIQKFEKQHKSVPSSNMCKQSVTHAAIFHAVPDCLWPCICSKQSTCVCLGL